MAKRRAYSFTAVVMIALAAGLAFQSDAGILIFHDQDSWQSALGTPPGLQYNFNSFSVNTSFALGPLNLGPFALSAHGVPPAGTDLIVTDDNEPESFTTVDRTPYASMFIDSTRSVLLDFHQPMLAFGAQFVSGGAYNFGVAMSGTRAGPAIIEGPPAGGQFFGFISTEPFDQISFLYAGPADSSTSVSLDNLAATAVPEPSSLMILGAGAVMFAVYAARRLRHGSKVDPGN